MRRRIRTVLGPDFFPSHKRSLMQQLPTPNEEEKLPPRKKKAASVEFNDWYATK